MSFIRSSAALLLLAASSCIFAAPELRVEAGYTQFELQREFDEPLFYAPYLFHDHDNYDSDDAVHAAVELAWSAGDEKPRLKKARHDRAFSYLALHALSGISRNTPAESCP